MIIGGAAELAAAIAAVLAIAFIAARALPLRLRRPWSVLAPPLLVLLAAAGFVAPGGEPAGRILLLDVSASMGSSALSAESVSRASGLEPEGVRLVAFGRGAVVVPAAAGFAVRPAEVARAGPTGSDLAAGIAAASSLLNGGGEVTVVTDGRVDMAAASRAAAIAAGRGIRVRVVSAGRPRRGDARVDSLRVPSRVSASGRGSASVSVRSEPGDSLVVRLLVDGEETAARSLRIGAGGGASLRFDLPLLEEGFHAVEATVARRAPDSEPGNDRLGSGLVVSSKRRALVAGSVPPSSVEGFESVAWDPSSPVPTDADLVVLGNLPSTSLDGRGAGLARFVAGGGGLLVLGGSRSFGPGAYSGRPIEDCLPVLGGSGDGKLRVVVLLDRSATMGEPFRGADGGAKLEAAKVAARALLEALPMHATFTLASFSRQVDSRAGPFSLTDPEGLAQARAAIGAVRAAGGGTALVPPLSLALDEHRGEPEDRRLAILVTDGRLEAEGREKPVEVAGALRRSGVRLAVLAVGQDADLVLLRALLGGDDPAVVRDSGEVEQAFIDALLDTEGEGLIRIEDLAVRSGPGAEPPWAGELPSVSGYVRARPREAAEVWFETAGGDPLVAGWRHGLGRAVAVLTDPAGEWAGDWSTTPVLRALAGWAARPAAAGGIRGEVRVSPAGTTLTVRLPGRIAVADGVIRTADGAERSISFSSVGDGLLRGRTGELPAGPALLSLRAGEAAYSGGVCVPYPEDLGESGPDGVAVDGLKRAIEAVPAPGAGRNLALVPAGLALLVFLGDRAARIRRRRLKGRGRVDR